MLLVYVGIADCGQIQVDAFKKDGAICLARPLDRGSQFLYTVLYVQIIIK